MASPIKIKVIKPQSMDLGALEKAIERGLDDGAKIVKRSFNETQSTFKRKFPIKIKSKRGWRLIWVDSDIYSYLSRGTKIRWALMSGDWKSKTHPGRFRPGPGRGRPILIGRRAMLKRGIPPRPGIKARNYPKKIIKRDAGKIQTKINAAIEKGAKGLY